MTLRWLVRDLPNFDRLLLAGYLVLSLIGALAGSMAAVLLVPLVQPSHRPLLGGSLFGFHASITVQAGVFSLATAVFAVLRWQTARLGSGLTSRFGVRLRQSVHARMIGAPLSEMADSTSAEIANVLTQNVDIVSLGFGAFLQLLVAAVTTVVSIAFACWVSPPLVLAAPVLALAGVIAARAFSREQARVSREYVAETTRLFWRSEEFPRRLRHVHSFGQIVAEKTDFDASATRLGEGYRRLQNLFASGRLVLELLVAGGVGIIFILADGHHGGDSASLIAVCLLLGRLLPYLTSARQGFQQMRSAVPAFELWQRYMNLQTVAASTVSDVPAGGVLWIERLCLASPRDLRVTDLALTPGTLTLIRGDSGIGKSSLVDVLAGMMVPDTFIAHLGGQALSFEGYQRLVQRGAYVGQSVRPWQLTVRDCLLWAAPEASDEMLIGALKDVGLAERVLQSGQGLDTSLQSSSSRLSGGELQRLMLAQVLLREPVLAVLDEATSALDAAAEISVLAILKRRLPRARLVVVSHRDSVLAVAEQCLTIGEDGIGLLSAQEPLRRTQGGNSWIRS